jgi:hypothetical protein
LILPRAGGHADVRARSLLPEVSSTEVRALLGRARPGDPIDPALGALLPRAVLDYAVEQRLYETP